ncbi:hypothetical protein KK083_22255 [Fulvivirgaceae bacterium PWU4]|uniref:Peptidase C45 hydrolase domain-containing protein n=1 Tax=Chryseosolibacter histidini TaxID=2782349 RepID=A0AAP2GQ01_9BACT|nr:C45 family peptidase [Chryseosolibacter histidini]MBT1699638.1 hypothetical protein [Chryseosolibacter histidini]
METTEQIVNLDWPVEKRWAFLRSFTSEMDELLDCYLKDFSGAQVLLDGLGAYKKAIIPERYLDEIDYIASISRFDADSILAANLYYDLLKFYFGCTAFAVGTGETIYHARNLDWHTDNKLLSRYSMIFDFQIEGKTIYKTVGWPGFVGALSGIKPNGFSITLNAVSSTDPPQIALPVTFLIRDVLASATTYDEARRILETDPIVSDCLILLSGTSPGQKVVIERTPTRSVTRKSDADFIVVTNDYMELNYVKKTQNGESGNTLQITSCSRYERALELLRLAIPKTSEGCLNILKDDEVMMSITVQQMVFNNRTGEIQLIKA